MASRVLVASISVAAQSEPARHRGQGCAVVPISRAHRCFPSEWPLNRTLCRATVSRHITVVARPRRARRPNRARFVVRLPPRSHQRRSAILEPVANGSQRLGERESRCLETVQHHALCTDVSRGSRLCHTSAVHCAIDVNRLVQRRQVSGAFVALTTVPSAVRTIASQAAVKFTDAACRRRKGPRCLSKAANRASVVKRCRCADAAVSRLRRARQSGRAPSLRSRHRPHHRAHLVARRRRHKQARRVECNAPQPLEPRFSRGHRHWQFAIIQSATVLRAHWCANVSFRLSRSRSRGRRERCSNQSRVDRWSDRN